MSAFEPAGISGLMLAVARKRVFSLSFARSVAFAPASSRYSAIVRGDARQAGRHPLFSNQLRRG